MSACRKRWEVPGQAASWPLAANSLDKMCPAMNRPPGRLLASPSPKEPASAGPAGPRRPPALPHHRPSLPPLRPSPPLPHPGAGVPASAQCPPHPSTSSPRHHQGSRSWVRGTMGPRGGTLGTPSAVAWTRVGQSGSSMERGLRRNTVTPTLWAARVLP